jgi:hypothetical protein
LSFEETFCFEGDFVVRAIPSDASLIGLWEEDLKATVRPGTNSFWANFDFRDKRTIVNESMRQVLVPAAPF